MAFSSSDNLPKTSSSNLSFVSLLARVVCPNSIFITKR
nr:MAG TPA: hypothetical protein [Caudoviricetes sp.]